MNIIAQRMGAPRKRYDFDKAPNTLDYTDDDHTPYNKRHGEVKSRLVVSVESHVGHVAVRLTETTKANRNSDRVQTRTISATMTREHAEAFARFILETKGE